MGGDQGWVRNTLIEANKVVQAINLKLLCESEENLVCNNGSSLEIYTIIPHGDTKQSRRESIYLRQNVHHVNTYVHPYMCPIMAMEVLSPMHIPVDILCIVSADYRLTLLFYNNSTKSLEVLWTFKTVSPWENINIASPPKIQIYPSQEFIGILPIGAETFKLFKFCLSSLRYEPSRGIHCGNKVELPYRVWNFPIIGSVMDFVFHEQKSSSGHSGRPLGGYKKDFPGLANVPSSSLPNSPRGYSMTPPSPRTTSPYVGSYTSPGASPIYHSQPTSPFGVGNVASYRSPSPNDKSSYSNTKAKDTVVVQEEFITIYTLLQVTENASKYNLKKLKLYLHTNIVKEDSVTESFPIGSKLLLTKNNGIFCFGRKEMNFYHNNKKKMFPLELEGLPKHCVTLTDDCYIVVDEFGDIMICILQFEKDRYTVNRISRRRVRVPPNQNLNVFAITLVSSVRRTGSKFGTYIVFLVSDIGDSWIVRNRYFFVITNWYKGIINADEVKLDNRLILVKSFRCLAPITACHFLNGNCNAEKQFPDTIIWSGSGVNIVQSRAPVQHLATFQQSGINQLWVLSQVDNNKTKTNTNCDEFLCLSVGNHSTHVLSVPDNLVKSSFMRGFDENQTSLFIGSLSDPIAVQVTPREANVVNRFTGTLLSEWRAPGQLASQPFTLATMVGPYLCIVQNNDTIHLNSCETPSVGTTNNRLRKICLQLETTKELSDEIICWDTISFPTPIKLSANITKQPQDDITMEDAGKTSNSNDDSMVDIWEDICMEASMGATSIPTIEETDNLANLQIEGIIVACTKHSHSIVLLSAPTLSTLSTYSLGTNCTATSVVVYSTNHNHFEYMRVLVGLTDGSIFAITFRVSVDYGFQFQASSVVQATFARSSNPLPCRLYKLPAIFLDEKKDTVANILLSTDSNFILECHNTGDFTSIRIGIEETISSICFFTEERCGPQRPFFFYSTPKALKLATIHWDSLQRDNSSIKQLTPLRVTPLLKHYSCVACCVSPKTSTFITLVKSDSAEILYTVQTFNLHTFSLLSSMKLPQDVSEAMEIYDHPLQDENMFVVMVDVQGEGYFILYSFKENEITEKCRVLCDSRAKIVSVFGLLLCCTYNQIVGYSWNTSASQMTQILEYKYSDALPTIDSTVVSFTMQRVANYIQEGQVLGTQFRLLVSGLLENTKVLDFSLGKGETRITQIGEIVLPRRKLFGSEFVSVSGDEFVISDHTGVISFVQCISENHDGDKFTVSIKGSYYAGEAITMLKYYPPGQQLILGSMFGRLMSLSPVEIEKLKLLKEVASGMQSVLPCAGDHVERELEMEYYHVIEQMKAAKEEYYSTWSGTATFSDDDISSITTRRIPFPSANNVVDGDLLNLFLSFISQKQQDIVSAGTSLSIEETRTLVSSAIGVTP